MLLAGDVGGTKTNLAIFASKDTLHEPVREAKLPSAHYPSLSSLIQDFLVNEQCSIDRAVFGVAGPVVEGQAKITNLPWIMQELQLQNDLHIPSVHLLNDLQAAAHAIPLLPPADLHCVNKGNAEPHAPIAVIAPGTGLGEAFLIWDGTHYRPYPSEGGHADFAPTNHLEAELLTYMLKRLRHVSYEHVCSGIGLPNIYAYLKESGAFPEPGWLVEELAQAEDHTPHIVDAALAGRDGSAICVETLKIFLSILGAEAGNMALKILATGGVSLAGGIPPRILPLFAGSEFMRSFTNKGRFSNLLANIPVQVVLNTKVGLIGAAAYGFDL